MYYSIRSDYSSTNQIVIKQASQISLTKHDWIGYGCLTLSLKNKKPNYDNIIWLWAIRKWQGVIFYGDGPYVLLPNIDDSRWAFDDSQSLTYTPLFIKESPQLSLSIGVKSINLNDKIVPLDTTSLLIESEGFGWTKIRHCWPLALS